MMIDRQRQRETRAAGDQRTGAVLSRLGRHRRRPDRLGLIQGEPQMPGRRVGEHLPERRRVMLTADRANITGGQPLRVTSAQHRIGAVGGRR